ncbi:sel1 repeat family protein [Oleiharenicola lentus]|uniref:Sel1 repeat family protein n=1 Tax=Oleiharenicola lentus TaxID=2508720 RepID=A0A4Q1C432_9BACT|nr:tetratricopeptide repeat protein [Oleiharenicola lentus]RXK53111.1 sel1 repeat family protein [Oleiharenicola lentus]
MKRALALLVLAFMLAADFAIAADSTEIKELKKKAEDGDPNAQFLLGRHYFLLTEKAEGAKWYHRAAEQGNADAQNMLGVIYGDGNGVKKDSTLAVNWFLKAAENRNRFAQENLGMHYWEGVGVPRNLVESFAWFSAAGDDASYLVKKWLKKLRSEMTPEQIAEATKLARERFEKYGKQQKPQP